MIECAHDAPSVTEAIADGSSAVKCPAATETIHVIRNVIEIAVMNETAEETFREPIPIEVIRPQRSGIDVAGPSSRVADSSDVKPRREIIRQSGNDEKPR